MSYERLMAFLFLSLAAAGCGGPSYKASPAEPVTGAAEMTPGEISGTGNSESGQLSVMADSYTDASRQQAVFDADFAEAGILAIRLNLRNGAGHSVRVRREDMTMTLPGGHRLSPISAQSAANFVTEKTGESFIVTDIFWQEVLGLDSQPARDRRRARKSRDKRTEDYRRKELTDAVLAAGESAQGFVFFRPPPGTPAFDAASLTLELIPAGDAPRKTVSQRVAGLGFAGSKKTPVTYIPRSARGFVKCPSGEFPQRPWVGTWKARSGVATLTAEISGQVVMGKITTPTHVYAVRGTVEDGGRVKAVIEHPRADNEASLAGEFPRLLTQVNTARPSQYWPLSGLVFRLCS